jgi:hypothetical protein
MAKKKATKKKANANKGGSAPQPKLPDDDQLPKEGKPPEAEGADTQKSPEGPLSGGEPNAGAVSRDPADAAGLATVPEAETEGDLAAEPENPGIEPKAVNGSAGQPSVTDLVRTLEVSMPLALASSQLKFRADLGELSRKAAYGARLVQGGVMLSGQTNQRGQTPETVPAAINWLLEQIADAYDES